MGGAQLIFRPERSSRKTIVQLRLENVLGCLLACTLAACGDDEESRRKPLPSTPAREAARERAADELQERIDNLRAEVDDEIGEDRIREALDSLFDQQCTINCSGHVAGYIWAEQNSIDDEDDCQGQSLSFIEGCRKYAEKQVPLDSVVTRY